MIREDEKTGSGFQLFELSTILLKRWTGSQKVSDCRSFRCFTFWDGQPSQIVHDETDGWTLDKCYKRLWGQGMLSSNPTRNETFMMDVMSGIVECDRGKCLVSTRCFFFDLWQWNAYGLTFDNGLIFELRFSPTKSLFSFGWYFRKGLEVRHMNRCPWM